VDNIEEGALKQFRMMGVRRSIGEDDSLLTSVEASHGDFETFVDPAQHVGSRDAHILHNDHAGWLGVPAHLGWGRMGRVMGLGLTVEHGAIGNN